MKHILLVEDDVWLRDLYSLGLKRVAGSTVHTAASAPEALEVLDEHTIDLLILDMFLGEFNGIEFLHELKTYTDTLHIPVIILSAVHAHDFAMSEQRWREYNVVKYLYKPDTKPEDLCFEVRKSLVGKQ